MSGPLGTSGGGAAGVTSVTAGNGITVTGTTTPTIAASIAAGTGVSIAGTTTLTVSATGVNSIVAGTAISTSGSTTITVNNTGVTSLAGTGISVSASTGAVTITAPVVAGGTGITVSGSQTTSLSITNTGVTSIVAGTNVSVSGATGAVTVNAPAYGTTITASTIGGTAAAGTSTSVAREDHRHAFPAGAAPSALTVSSTQATGTSTAPALADHVHAMPGSAVAGASAVGDTAATGTATTVALSDHRHSREAFGTPGAVTGGATAASGSAGTLARSDHVHSTASMPVLIARQTLTSGAATVTFSSIPSTYINLHLHIMARNSLTSAAIQTAFFRVNGLSTSIYDDGYTSTTTTGINTPSSASGTFRTDGWCELQYVLYNYASSNNRKLVAGVYNFNTSAGGIGQASNRTFNLITLTSAITSIAISVANTGSDTWVTGSTFDLYGIP